MVEISSAPEAPYFLKIREFSSRNGFSESFTFKLIRTGRLHAVKIGGATRITLDEEAAFRAARTREVAA